MPESSEVPTKTAGDVAHALVKGGLGAIPIAGGFAGEVFALILRPPLERRSEDWMRQIAQRLATVESADSVRFNSLPEDDDFCSVAIAATQAAFRSRHADKTALLANAVQRAAAGSIVAADLQLIFVRYVDELTVTHVRMLAVLKAAAADLRSVSSYDKLLELFVSEAGTNCTPDEFMLLCADLTGRALLRISVDLNPFDDVVKASHLLLDLEGIPTEPMARVTDIGEQFLDFVADYPAGSAA